MAVRLTTDAAIPLGSWMRLADLPGEYRLLALLLAAGLTYHEVAAALSVTWDTARDRVYRLARGLGITRRVSPRHGVVCWVWLQQPDGVTARMRRRRLDRRGVR